MEEQLQPKNQDTKEKIKKGVKKYIGFRMFLWKVIGKPMFKMGFKASGKLFKSGLTGKDPWEV